MSSDDYRLIATTPRFPSTTVLVDAENEFEELELYAWDGKLFRSIKFEGLLSRIWSDIVAIDDSDLHYNGWADAQKTRQLVDVAKRFPGWRSVSWRRLRRRNSA